VLFFALLHNALSTLYLLAQLFVDEDDIIKFYYREGKINKHDESVGMWLQDLTSDLRGCFLIVIIFLQAFEWKVMRFLIFNQKDRSIGQIVQEVNNRQSDRLYQQP